MAGFFFQNFSSWVHDKNGSKRPNMVVFPFSAQDAFLHAQDAKTMLQQEISFISFPAEVWMVNALYCLQIN